MDTFTISDYVKRTEKWAGRVAELYDQAVCEDLSTVLMTGIKDAMETLAGFSKEATYHASYPTNCDPFAFSVQYFRAIGSVKNQYGFLCSIANGAQCI